MNVKVTGMSMLTCLGDNIEDVWEEIRDGNSGINDITLFPTDTLRSCRGGEVKGNYPSDGYNRMKSFAKIGILKAIKDTGLTIEKINELKSAIIIGTSLGHIFDNEKGAVQLDDYVNELVQEIGLQVPHICISSACSSGSDAIILAGDLLEYKGFDLVICGGLDILDIYKMRGHSSLRTLAVTQCKPFSSGDETGTSLGEGAAFLVLETNELSCERSARVYANLVASSNTTDTISVTTPDETGAGAIRLIEQAMSRSEHNVNDISYINAHGSGTAANDKMEAKVYREFLSIGNPAISSTKGIFGHTLGATGAIEAIMCIMAIVKKEAPPTAICEKVSKDWENANVVLNKSLPLADDLLVTVSVTYGFGGANACLVFDNLGVETQV